MALVPLRINSFSHKEPLPFNIYDSSGRLLGRKDYLPPKHVIENYITRGTIYTTETESRAWDRRVIGHAITQIRNNSQIKIGDLTLVRPSTIK